jgi:hypothetical protein
MIHQLATARRVDDPGAFRHRPARERQSRMLLVTVPPEQLPPVSFGSTLFQRARIVIFREGDLGDAAGFGGIDPAQVLGELPLLRAAAAMAASPSAPAPRPRRLQGELLCDEAGRLYEKIGSYVRPVHQLVAGPRGEVLDLAPPSKTRSAARNAADVIDVPDADVSEASTPDEEGSAAACRELIPRSAQPRIVRFGEFKTMLGPQLLHPERLRDTHRLSCGVRVFESPRKQRLDAFAADALGGASTQLLQLTAALAARLEIGELVSTRAHHGRDREPGWILPGERVVFLSVLHDPTAMAAASRSANECAASSARSIDASAPTRLADPLDRAARTADGPRMLCNAIPDRFLAPWQFAFGRDEAIYDLDQRAGRWWRSLVDCLLGAASRGRERRKWQALLAGRTVDDQLWAVRPPRGWLTSADVRAWARRTLDAGGYDANTMLREWEIYWQRKGEGTKAR